MLDSKAIKDFVKFQQDEIDATEIYARLAAFCKTDSNKDVLSEMSKEENGHYKYISKFTGRTLKYNKFKVVLVCTLARLFGLTFILKLLEKDESKAVSGYREYEQLASFADTEEEHEQRLLNMIDEQGLRYMGSIVLGLNDALVEFTGALAGYTLALSSCSMIALTGSITGIAAALSMGSSEYLSRTSDGEDRKHSLLAAFYTSLAYIITVFLLIAPYLWIPQPIVALVVMLVLAILIIAGFNFYYSVVRSESFKKRFVEMALISFSVAALSFVIGYLLKIFTGIGE